MTDHHDELSERTRAIAESATLAMDAKAKALAAAGKKVINFSAGEPDFATPAHILDAVRAAVADPKLHHYTPTPGLPDLRAAIADKTTRDAGVPCTANQVLVTNGAKHALYTAFQVLCNPGDEVLITTPCWNSYPEMVRLAGGIPVLVPTTQVGDFKATIHALEAAFSARTKVLLFVSPNNPTGTVYSPAETEAIGAWAVSHGLWVVTDEIYEHLVYAPYTFTSLPGVVPEIQERCIIINGVSKTYAMTGWRAGWLVGPPSFVKIAANLQSHLTSNVAGIVQVAALAALRSGLGDVAVMREAYTRRGAALSAGLADLPGVSCLPAQGAFYCFPSFAGVLGRTLAGRTPNSSLELCDLLLEEALVACVPGEAFAAPGHIRLSFALADADLAEGLQRLSALLTS